MTLDIFTHRFGDDVLPALDNENRGLIAKGMLDAIQTVVDVIADDENTGYAVHFAPTMSAFTEHQKRQIVISGLPLLASPVGTPLTDIAAILTGFAVHEVGHTRRVGIIDAARAEWPGKILPKTLANVIEDVVLELRTIRNYAGFRDIFAPTLAWVAEATCPKHTLVWEGTTGHKVNLVGQIVRYRPFVTFGEDAVTVAELQWWDEWASRIVVDLTPEGGVQMVRDALAHLAAQREAEPVEPPPGEGEGEGPGGQSLPDEEDDSTEGGQPTDDEPQGDEPEGETDEGGQPGGDNDDDADTEGGDGEDDGDGEDEGPGGTEGDDDEPGEIGEDNDGEPTDTDGGDQRGDPGAERVELEQGAQDSDGSGGTGQGVAEAGEDDPDAGLDETELDQSFDDISHTDNGYADQRLENAAEEEAKTSRLDGGAFGTIRVVWE
jgi:hypothetical protein